MRMVVFWSKEGSRASFWDSKFWTQWWNPTSLPQLPVHPSYCLHQPLVQGKCSMKAGGAPSPLLTCRVIWTNGWTPLASEDSSWLLHWAAVERNHFLLKHSVNRKMPFPMFIMTWIFWITVNEHELSRIKDIFIKRWASLENELSMMKKYIREAPFGYQLFQIDPCSFGHSRLPSTQSNTSQILSFKRILLFSK